jgi:formate dehydrogenase iron-sulfur subunit
VKQLPLVGNPRAWPESYGEEAKPRVGFFTDTTVCIGCKACEVACKQWNLVPDDGFVFTGSSYDNTAALGANTWRHVAFIEQDKPLRVELSAEAAEKDDAPAGLRWLMSSDVCKHCTNAACLDVCPTGALFRSEYGTVVVQQEVCNGCGYCVPACPFGVIDRREIEGAPGKGVAQKCTLCYDRAKDGLEPACAKACPTESIQFGELDELRERAAERLGAFFLLLDDPEVYGLPPDPVATTRDLPSIWGAALVAAGTLAAMVGLAVAGDRS